MEKKNKEINKTNKNTHILQGTHQRIDAMTAQNKNKSPYDTSNRSARIKLTRPARPCMAMFTRPELPINEPDKKETRILAHEING